MDACITPIRHGGLSLVQSTSFFYVLVDDPYMMVNSSCSCFCDMFLADCYFPPTRSASGIISILLLLAVVSYVLRLLRYLFTIYYVVLHTLKSFNVVKNYHRSKSRVTA